MADPNPEGKKKNPDAMTGPQRKRALQQIEREYLSETTPQAKPRAIILGGQPGSGKGYLANQAMNELHKDGVLIDPDRLRNFHPEYRNFATADHQTAAARVNSDAASLTADLRRKAIAQHRNIIYDTALNNPESTERFFDDLRNAGYDIDVRIMAVSRQTSTRGVADRLETQIGNQSKGAIPRAVSAQVQQDAYHGMPLTVEHIEANKLANRVRVYRRNDDEPLYDSAHPNQHTAAQVIAEERNRPMTPLEKVQNVQEWDHNVNRALHRQASAEELAPYRKAQAEAHALLEKDPVALAEYKKGIPTEAHALDHTVVATTRNETTAAETTTNLIRESETLSKDMSAVRKIGGEAGPFIGLGVAGAIVLVGTRSPAQAATATLDAAVPGASTGFKDIRNRHARTADRVLDTLDTGTATVMTVAGTTALATSVTGVGPAGAGGVALTAGTLNVGVQVLRDVAYYTGVAEKPGIVGATVNGVREVNANTDAELELFRALRPLHAIQSKIIASAHDIHGNITPELRDSCFKFGFCTPWDAQKQLQTGGQFAHALSRDLMDKGANGDTLRRVLGPAMQKAGVTPEQYSMALETYAKALDSRRDVLVHSDPNKYTETVHQTAQYLTSPPPSDLLPHSPQAHGRGAERQSLKTAHHHHTDDNHPKSTPSHRATGRGAARQTLTAAGHHSEGTAQASSKTKTTVKPVKLVPTPHHDV